MNFQGRYYTYNDTCVAVHPLKEEIVYDNEVPKYVGHVIRLEAPFKDERVFYWNEKGNCINVVGSFVPLHDYDLNRRVNPMSYPDQIEVVGCEECSKERKAKLDAKKG